MHKVYSVTDRLSVQQDVIFISVEFYEFLFSRNSGKVAELWRTLILENCYFCEFKLMMNFHLI